MKSGHTHIVGPYREALLSHQADDFPTLIRGKVTGWLEDEGWDLEGRDNPEAHWTVLATSEKRRVMVSQPVDRRDLIVISTGWRLPEATTNEVLALETRIRRSLAYDIQHTLLLLGVDFSGAGDPIKEMVFGLTTYFDGLSKDLFMTRVNIVCHAPMLAQGLVSKALNRHPA